MFLKFKNSTAVVFLDPHSGQLIKAGDSQSVDVILSPSLYWVQRLDLPVKYLRDVRKLLPSLFEDILPQGRYNYEVFKDAEGFIAFAYEDKEIIEQLTQKGINLSQVRNVYFAQTEFQEKQLPCAINETEALMEKEGLVIITPKRWFQDIKELLLEGIELSNKAIKLQQFSHIIDHKSLYRVGAVLVAFIAILLSEIFVVQSKIEDVQIQKAEVFKKHKLLRTTFQNKALYEKYSKIFSQQTKLREDLYAILSLPLGREQKITHISFGKKLLHVKLSNVGQKEQKRFETLLKKKMPKLSTKLHGDTLTLEAKI